MNSFLGRHETTGTITNCLAAMGAVDPYTQKPCSEALVLGASGGIAFGYFVFEYKGNLPHVSLLTRNTFAPFVRSLDNLAIRRETRETVKPEKAQENLDAALDGGYPAIVMADHFSLPHTGLCGQEMWYMRPLLVISRTEDEYQIVDRQTVFSVTREQLLRARGKVKKDRFHMLTLEPPSKEGVADGLRRGIETGVALFLDKPAGGLPAHSFGLTGMRRWARLLVDKKDPKCWTKMFAPGPRLVQALAGSVRQPGV